MPFRVGPRAVFGIYYGSTAADEAVERFKRAGFHGADISVLMPSKEGDAHVVFKKATKSSEGAAVGSASGALLGAGFGWLSGLGALGIPGIGPFIAAGPLLSALAGIGVGATVGGIAGALVGLGIPEYEAKRFEGFVKEGRVLLSVHVPDASSARRATGVFRESGAHDIAVAGETKAPEIAASGSRPLTKADDYQFHK